jgi:hypothetical protein
VTEEAVLNVLGLEGLAQKGILREVEHADGEIVAGAPVGIHFAKFFFGQDPDALRTVS